MPTANTRCVRFRACSVGATVLYPLIAPSCVHRLRCGLVCSGSSTLCLVRAHRSSTVLGALSSLTRTTREHRCTGELWRGWRGWVRFQQSETARQIFESRGILRSYGHCHLEVCSLRIPACLIDRQSFALANFVSERHSYAIMGIVLCVVGIGTYMVGLRDCTSLNCTNLSLSD